MRSCYSRAEKYFHILSECRCQGQGSVMVFGGIRGGLIWNCKKQMSSIDERHWHVVENTDFKTILFRFKPRPSYLLAV